MELLLIFLQLLLELTLFLDEYFYCTCWPFAESVDSFVYFIIHISSTFPIQFSRRSTSMILWSLSAILASAVLMVFSASSSRLMYSSSWACVHRNTYNWIIFNVGMLLKWLIKLSKVTQLFYIFGRTFEFEFVWRTNCAQSNLSKPTFYDPTQDFKWTDIQTACDGRGNCSERRPVAVQSPSDASVAPPPTFPHTPAAALLTVPAVPECEPHGKSPPGQFTGRVKTGWGWLLSWCVTELLN